MLLADYTPSKLVEYLHLIPRGGFSNDISDLFGEKWLDYVLGIVAASSLYTSLAILWCSILLLLKCTCGADRVGCAAGGQGALYIPHSMRGVPKAARKRRIRRHWRLQTAALLICGVMALPINFIMIQWGLRPIVEAVEELGYVNDGVESIAYRALHITEQFRYAQNKLLIEIPNEIGNFSLSSLCGDAQFNNTSHINATESNETGTGLIDPDSMKDVLDIFDDFQGAAAARLSSVQSSFGQVESAESALYKATKMTDIVDQLFDVSLQYDWVLKLAVLVLDVVVAFWIFAIIVAQNSVDWPALHRISALLFLPTLCLLLLFFVGTSFVFTGASLANADFCAGTEVDHSPLGVFREAFAPSKEDVYAEVFDYYRSVCSTPKEVKCVLTSVQDCLDENPFVERLSPTTLAVIDVDILVKNILVGINTHAETASTFCNTNGTMISEANKTFTELQDVLYNFKGNLVAAVKLSECSNVGPILRRLLYGATCDEFTQAIVCLSGSMMATVAFILLIISTRASVFSPIIRGRRCKKRELEFEDYKNYMAQFYDTKTWTIDCVPPLKEDEEFPPIRRTETRSTASPTSSDDSDTVLAFAAEDDNPLPSRPRDDDGSHDDSYDSTYSSDDEDDNDDVTAFSAMSKFFERYRTSLQTGRQGGDSESAMTTSSLLSQFKEGGLRMVSLFVKDRYSHPIDEENEDFQKDSDTAVGTMSTPQPIRYTARLRFSGSKREDPEDFEMIALSPKHAKSPMHPRYHQHY